MRKEREILEASDRRGWWMLFVGIFFVFAPLPVLLMGVPQRPWSPAFVLVSGVVGGLISVSWAATFIFRRFWWIALIVPLSVLVPWALSIGMVKLGVATGIAEPAAPTYRFVYAVIGIVSIVAGYVLLVTIIRRIERSGERSRAELDVARNMHKSIVPEIELSTSTADIYARSEASSEMGGDLIDVVVRDGGAEADVFLADVSGHGVGAGIVMGMLKASIRTRLLAGGDLGSMLTDVNRIVFELTKPEMFATLACVRIGRGRVCYAIAGHLPIVRVAASGSAHDEFENQHLPLGIDAPLEFTSGAFETKAGDVLAILSDGLVEVRDSSDREFGLVAANRLVSEEVLRIPSAPLSDVYARVVRTVREFGPQVDDQSLMLVRIKQA